MAVHPGLVLWPPDLPGPHTTSNLVAVHPARHLTGQKPNYKKERNTPVPFLILTPYLNMGRSPLTPVPYHLPTWVGGRVN